MKKISKLIVLLLLVGTTAFAQQGNPSYFVLNVYNTTVRQTPNNAGRVIHKGLDNKIYKIIAITEGWYKFMYEGQEAYVKTSDASGLYPAPIPQSYLKADMLYGHQPDGTDVLNMRTLNIYKRPKGIYILDITTMRVTKDGRTLPALMNYYVGLEKDGVIAVSRANEFGSFDDSLTNQEILQNTKKLPESIYAIWDSNSQVLYFDKDIYSTQDPNEPVDTSGWN